MALQDRFLRKFIFSVIFLQFIFQYMLFRERFLLLIIVHLRIGHLGIGCQEKLVETLWAASAHALNLLICYTTSLPSVVLT